MAMGIYHVDWGSKFANFTQILSIFLPVFIGYGLKTGQGFYPGPPYLQGSITIYR